MYQQDNSTTEENLSAIGEFTDLEQSLDNVEPDGSDDKSPCELLLSYFKPIQFMDKFKYVPRGNIIEEFSDDSFLLEVGRNVLEGFDADDSSMDEWKELVRFGLDLIEQETQGRSIPWDNAANFKSPLLQEAALAYSDRVATELLRKDDLVKVKVFGKKTDEKEAASDRISTYLNYKIDEEMKEWRDEQETLIYCLPYSGTAFKKTFFDPHLGRITSSLITYPDFVVDRACPSMERLRRFSEEFELSKNECIERMRSGLWREIDFNDVSEDSEAPSDKYQLFVEQQGFYDLDKDGYEEPYTFVVHKGTSNPVRIIPRFDPHGVIVRKIDGDDREITLSALYEKSISTQEIFDQITGVVITSKEEVNMADYEVVRITPKSNITKYGFLKDPEGGLLDIGYCHLLSGMVTAINTITNQVVDAGTLSNLQGGFIAKGFRAKMGDMRVKPGSWNQTGLSAQDMKDGILPHPFKEPSAALMQSRQMIKEEAQSFASSVDLKGALSAQAPATTTLALVNEQEGGIGSILLRTYRSMTAEFTKIGKLIMEFDNPDEYALITEDESADFYKDFNCKISKVSPNANPDFSSKMQRLQLAEACISPIPALMAMPGVDFKPVITYFYKELGFPYYDKIAPDSPPEQQLQQLLMSFPQLQQLISSEEQRQNLIAETQAKSIEQQEARAAYAFTKDMELKDREAAKIAADTDLKRAQEANTEADRLKKLEEADKIYADNKKITAETQIIKEDVDTGRQPNDVVI